jgi:hypothetical protein
VQDITIDRSLGSAGVRTVTSYAPQLSDTGEGVGLDEQGMQQLAQPQVDESSMLVRRCKLAAKQAAHLMAWLGLQVPGCVA